METIGTLQPKTLNPDCGLGFRVHGFGNLNPEPNGYSMCSGFGVCRSKWRSGPRLGLGLELGDSGA